MDNSDDYFDRAIKWYFIYRFLWACLDLAVIIVGGICLIVYWIFYEVSLELNYRDKYGADWRAEFEKYHGTLSHAHNQVAICVTSILAIVVILIWFCRQTFHKHKRHIHKHRGG